MSDLTNNQIYPSTERIWLCIRSNNAGKYCDITLKIMVMLQNVCENCVRILEEEKHCQLRMFIILWKKWTKLASLSINQTVKSQKQCVHSKILLMWQEVCMKRHQQQFTVVLNNWTFRRHHWHKFCLNALVWRYTKFNWFKSWSQLTTQCVFASLSGPAIDLQKMPILTKKIIFSDEALLDLAGM